MRERMKPGRRTASCTPPPGVPAQSPAGWASPPGFPMTTTSAGSWRKAVCATCGPARWISPSTSRWGLLLCTALELCLDMGLAFLWQHSGFWRLHFYMDLLCCKEVKNKSSLCFHMLVWKPPPESFSSSQRVLAREGMPSPLCSLFRQTWDSASGKTLVHCCHGYELYLQVLYLRF